MSASSVASWFFRVCNASRAVVLDLSSSSSRVDVMYLHAHDCAAICNTSACSTAGVASCTRGRVYNVSLTCQHHKTQREKTSMLTRCWGPPEELVLDAAPESVPWGVATTLTRWEPSTRVRVVACGGCADVALVDLVRVALGRSEPRA